MDTSSKTTNHNLEHAVAGAVSGFVTRFICQPLDVVKIRFQVKTNIHAQITCNIMTMLCTY